MRQASWAGLFLAVLPFLAGCKGFWDAPTTGTNFSLSGSPSSLSISSGATSGNTSTISVTPANSFTGTVDLTCTVSGPTNASNAATCGLSPTSVDITGTTAVSATLTATTVSATTAGAYTVTVSGTSGSETETTTVCVVVTSGTCGTTAGTSGFFYVLSPSSIAGYTASSSALTSVSGSSFNLSGASAIAVATSGNFLYVASQSTGIVPYTINSSTGALTQGTEVIGDSAVEAMQIDPSGKWLLDANLAGTLTAYPITSTGAQDTTRTLQQVALASATVEQIAISPSGALISVALGATGTQSFSFIAGNNVPIGTGGSILTTPYGNGGNAISVAMDPQSRLLYIGEVAAFTSNTNSGALRVFTITTSSPGATSLQELPYASPYAPLGTGPHAILPDPTGKYVYVASWQTGSAGAITGYSVATSALTQIGTGTVATGTEPVALAEDSTSTFVLAVNNQGTIPLDAYTFDSTTAGQLDPASITGSTASNPIAIVAIPKQ
jgi:6-phosphogluconolactonase (cycloisomerase 2 family)